MKLILKVLFMLIVTSIVTYTESVTASSVRVDHIRITVYYTEAVGGSTTPDDNLVLFE